MLPTVDVRGPRPGEPCRRDRDQSAGFRGPACRMSPVAGYDSASDLTLFYGLVRGPMTSRLGPSPWASATAADCNFRRPASSMRASSTEPCSRFPPAHVQFEGGASAFCRSSRTLDKPRRSYGRYSGAIPAVRASGHRSLPWWWRPVSPLRSAGARTCREPAASKTVPDPDASVCC